ncbi:hypothetical protein AB1N83_004635 [Pleurotus pulmonarius]
MSDPTLGALQISTGISGFLLGCLVLQTYMYFTNYPRDSVWIKSLIVLIFALEFALHVSLTELSYNISIINAGNIFVLFHLPTWPISPFISIFAMPITEIFYLWRIYKLLHKMWPSLVGTAISLFRTSCWIYYFARAVRIGLPALAIDTERRWLVILLLSLALFLNVSIVLVMAIYLARHRDASAAKTRKLVDRLILWIISTGMIAMVPHITSLVLFLTMKGTLVWMCLIPISTKVFANCLISTLNARPVHTDVHRPRPTSKKVAAEDVSQLTSTIPTFDVSMTEPAFARAALGTESSATNFTEDKV